MSGFDTPSHEDIPDLEGSGGNEHLTGQGSDDALQIQYDRLLGDENPDVSGFAEGTKLRILAQEEHSELKEKFAEVQGQTLEESRYQRLDLAQEFGEDIRALNILKRDYEGKTGYAEFVSVLSSSLVTDAQREKLYDLLAREQELVDEFIDEDLDGEMFPDAESVQDMLAFNRMDVEKDEIREVLDKDVSSSSESELTYLDTKIDGLISQGVSRSFEGKLLVKQQGIIERRSEIEQGKSEIIDIEANIAAADVDTATEDVDTAAADVDTATEDVDTATEDVDTATEDVDTAAADVDTATEGVSIAIQKFYEETVEMVNLIKDKKLNISGDLQILLNQAIVEGVDRSTMVQTREEIKSFLKTNPGQIRDLLSQARGKSPEALRQTQQFLGALADGDPEFQVLIDRALFDEDLGTHYGSEIREAQATAYFGGEAMQVTDIEIDGATYTLDDLQVDASDAPPRAYVLGEDGLKLELGLPSIPSNKETLALRRDFAQTQLSLKAEFTEVSNEYKEKQGKLDRLDQLEQAKKDGENLSPAQETELGYLVSQKIQLEEDVIALKNKITSIHVRASNASQDFDVAMSDLSFDYEAIQKQQETARFSLQLMKSFGIDRIGQDRFNQMIAEVKNGQLIVDIQSPNGFDPKKINIAAGTFGEIQGEAGGENFRENMARFVNLMYFGNPEGKSESGEQLGMNIETFKRVSEIDSIPGQDPSLVTNMQRADVNILTNAGDLNITKARYNLNNGIE